MPIRINLLAEQQAEADARRRDPVKRALWTSGAVLALILIWSGNLQLKLSGLKSELARQEARSKQIEPGFLQASNDFQQLGLIQKSLAALEKHTTNRFLWANSLDALQNATDGQVRVVTVSGASSLTEQKETTFSTNLFLNLPPKSWWAFRSEPAKTNLVELSKNLLGSITNRPEYLRYQSVLTSTLNVTTNRVQVLAQINVLKPETITEKVTLTFRARDYSSPAGKEVDAFYRGVTNSPYFKQFVGRTNSSVQPESIQPREDRSDLIHPSELYIPFIVELTFPDRIRDNE